MSLTPWQRKEKARLLAERQTLVETLQEVDSHILKFDPHYVAPGEYGRYREGIAVILFHLEKRGQPQRRGELVNEIIAGGFDFRDVSGGRILNTAISYWIGAEKSLLRCVKSEDGDRDLDVLGLVGWKENAFVKAIIEGSNET